MKIVNGEKMYSKDDALKICSVSGMLLNNINKKYKNDDDVAWTAITENGEAIYWLSNRLQNEKKYLIQAAKTSTYRFIKIYNYEELLSDKEFLKKLFEINGGMYKETIKLGIPEEWHEELAIIALKQNPYQYRYLSDKLRESDNIILAYLNGCGYSACTIDDELRALIRAVGDKGSYYLDIITNEFLALTKKVLNENKPKNGNEITKKGAIEICKINGHFLERLEKYRDDPEVIWAAITENGNSLIFAYPPFINDEKFVIQAAKTTYKVLLVKFKREYHLSRFIWEECLCKNLKNRELLKGVLGVNGSIAIAFDNEIKLSKNNSSSVPVYIINRYSEILRDSELMNIAVSQCPEVMGILSKELCKKDDLRKSFITGCGIKKNEMSDLHRVVLNSLEAVQNANFTEDKYDDRGNINDDYDDRGNIYDDYVKALHK